MSTEITNQIYELWEKELGMKRVQLVSNVSCLPKIDCFQFKDFFVRLCTFQEKGYGKVYCIEAADKEEAENNIFDDAWLYYESDGIESILAEMRADLSTA